MRQLSVTTTYQERLWGYIYLAAEILVLPLILGICNLFFNLHLSDATLNFLYFFINFLVVTGILYRFLLNNVKIALRIFPTVLITAGIGFVLYTASSVALSAAIRKLFPIYINANDSYISTLLSEKFALMFIGTAVLVPVAEELLYRGLIFNGLYNKNRLMAYLVSTLAFSVLHVYGYADTLSPIQLFLSLLEYIPAGLCLAWSYAKTDTIVTPIFIHMIVNSTAVLAMR